MHKGNKLSFYVKQIVATDLSEKMLEIAEKKARDAGVVNVSFQEGTLESLGFEAESFDAVLGLNVLHLIENVEATFSNVHRLLKPEGIFVSSTALVSEISFIWRLLIPVMQLVGLAPYVNVFGKEELLTKLTNAGFSIDRQWQPNKSSIFIVAKKHVLSS